MLHVPKELTQIAPLVWSNGHLWFDPVVRRRRRGWQVRLVGSDAGAEPVGTIRWHGLWGEYVLRTRDGYVFAQDCLSDISALIRHLNESHAWSLPAR